MLGAVRPYGVTRPKELINHIVKKYIEPEKVQYVLSCVYDTWGILKQYQYFYRTPQIWGPNNCGLLFQFPF